MLAGLGTSLLPSIVDAWQRMRCRTKGRDAGVSQSARGDALCRSGFLTRLIPAAERGALRRGVFAPSHLEEVLSKIGELPEMTEDQDAGDRDDGISRHHPKPSNTNQPPVAAG